MNENQFQEIEAWLDSVIIFDPVEPVVEGEDPAMFRRPLFLDNDRGRVFFFADPLDFDKDDVKVARYWIDQLEGYKKEWHETIVNHFLG